MLIRVTHTRKWLQFNKLRHTPVPDGEATADATPWEGVSLISEMRFITQPFGTFKV
jgi:hypothetical protein